MKFMYLFERQRNRRGRRGKRDKLRVRKSTQAFPTGGRTLELESSPAVAKAVYFAGSWNGK